ncbi:acyl-CoA dehydrogenase family protein [Chachezhania sediminis]|uniref:acyl-CoA dehydrogenase family protein n=1 Tax=Chachezhania sediminis TaxID=2599291 RepID=UPI00131C9943|nr:acyl-CoA dehydrogenase family protein [Chachezhania sediminis]
MDFSLTEDETTFRAEVRAFLQENLPVDIARRFARGYHPPKDDLKRWQAILHRKGWSAPHWPVEHGGPGWTAMQQFIFDDECALADAPPPSPFGLRLVGPVLYTFGSDAQKAEHLPKILSGEVFWCQGFSEPGAGSDLASLVTRADRDGDHYIVNGHKIWTTEAHFADMMFCLARTSKSDRRQDGISFLLLDMSDAGVTVRPIPTLDSGHTVNEVFLENVRVPATDLVGEEGRGWSYAKFLLDNERTFNSFVHRSRRDFRRMMAIAGAEGGALLEDPAFRMAAARVEIDLKALEWAVLRMLSGEVPDPVAAASALKLKGSQIQHAILDLAAEAMGPEMTPLYPDPEDGNGGALPFWTPDEAPGLMAQYLYRRAGTIYAGTSEVQRSIIYKQLSRG